MEVSAIDSQAFLQPLERPDQRYRAGSTNSSMPPGCASGILFGTIGMRIIGGWPTMSRDRRSSPRSPAMLATAATTHKMIRMIAGVLNNGVFHLDPDTDC